MVVGIHDERPRRVGNFRPFVGRNTEWGYMDEEGEFAAWESLVETSPGFGDE